MLEISTSANLFIIHSNIQVYSIIIQVKATVYYNHIKISILNFSQRTTGIERLEFPLIHLQSHPNCRDSFKLSCMVAVITSLVTSINDCTIIDISS